MLKPDSKEFRGITLQIQALSEEEIDAALNSDIKHFVVQRRVMNKLTSFKSTYEPNLIMALFKKAIENMHPINMHED